MDRSRSGVERIDRNALLGPSAVKQAAPGCERVRLQNAADAVALTLASRGLNDEAAAR
jgi:hypothetical protein